MRALRIPGLSYPEAMAHAVSSVKWLVVIPTIRQDRPGHAEVMARVRASFTQPTDFHILDGAEGKPAALNMALKDLLDAHNFYVTMDDDYVPGAGWQDLVAQAFRDLPRLGMAGLWVGPHDQGLVGAHRVLSPRTAGNTTYRPLERGHHVAGAFHAYRPDVARLVGPQPITNERYQVWEDAWRGRRVQALGYDLAFIEGATPEFITYDDPAEYIQWRESQVTQSRVDQDIWLRDSGIPDPITLRLRRWIARMRGRA